MKKNRTIMVLLSLACISAYASAALLDSDDFNESSINYTKWGTWTNDASKVGADGSAYWAAKYYNNTGATRGFYSNANNYELHTESDFDMSINYALTWDCPWQDGWRLTYNNIYFKIESNGHTVEIRRYTGSSSDGSGALFAMVIDGSVQGSTLTSAMTFESYEDMKLARVGDTLTAYGQTDGGWETVASADVSDIFTEFDSTAKVYMQIGVNTDRDGKLLLNSFDITQVPEPTVLALIAVGGFARLIRKRK